MVRQRRAEILRGTVVKPAKTRPHYARPQKCIWPGCRALLPHDHASPICSCHTQGYRLEHDPHASELVLHLLLAAYPDAINLTTVLGASKSAVLTRVRFLRRRGHAICGSPQGHGYWYEAQPNGCRRTAAPRTVKAKPGGAHA